MRERERLVGSLESVYRSAFQDADDAGDADGMRRLDFDFQRDQVFLEVLLDIRDLLGHPAAESAGGTKSLIDKAQALRNLTRLR
jgi:hypothetical protein